MQSQPLVYAGHGHAMAVLTDVSTGQRRRWYVVPVLSLLPTKQLCASKMYTMPSVPLGVDSIS